MNGAPPTGENNLKGTLLRHLTALVLVTELLVFLGIALLLPLDPGFINLSPQSEGIIVGGIMVSVQTIILSLFQSEATKQAARSAQIAHDAGAAAAMSTPSPASGSTIQTSEPVSVEGAPASWPTTTDMPGSGIGSSG